MADQNFLDQAKSFVQDKAGDLLQGDNKELKTKITDAIKNVTPDSIDDKVAGAVDSAVDFISDALKKK